MIILLVVGLLELYLDTFKSHVHGLAHVFFIGRSDHLRTGNVNGDFSMTLMFYFVVEDNGGTSDIRVETSQFVHVFLNTILKSSRCVKVTSRKLNVHSDTSVN